MKIYISRHRLISMTGKLTLGLLLLVASSFVHAADYYVDINHPIASDQNPGTESSPWRTVQKAAQVTLAPGDTVYVKAGVYDVSTGGTWERPAIAPRNSGLPGNPITFKSLPKHAAILDGGVSPGQSSQDGTQALIGSVTSHVVIDGFIVRNAFAKGILIMGAPEGVVIQNNIVSGVSHTHATDNSEGIRVERTNGAAIRNNLIFNIRNGSMSQNAAGVKIYDTSNSVFENNEVYDAASGIFDKRSGRNNIIRRNNIHDVKDGIIYRAADGYVAGGDQIYENIIHNTTNAVYLVAEGVIFDDDIKVFNNVLSEYSQIGVRAPIISDDRLSIYNNIFYRTNSVGSGDIVTYDDPARTIKNSDYNLFVNNSQLEIGRYVTNRFVSLSEWNSITGWDGNSQEANVEFANPGNDFHLTINSIARGFGRVGGVPTGAVVDAGAYTNENLIIGIMDDLLQPKSPFLEDVVVQ
jgi:parallel beta-helix repeat protein